MRNATIWGYNYRKNLTAGVPDPDPNVTDPHSASPGTYFNSGDRYIPHGIAAYIIVDGVNGVDSATVEVYAFLKGVSGGPTTEGKWMIIQAATIVGAQDPVQITVPPNADIHVRATAVAGAPPAMYVGIVPTS